MNPYAIEHARWEVMWVTRKKGKPHIVCIEHGTDFMGARRQYLMVRDAGKHMPTLRCANVGFAPTEKIASMMDAYNDKAIWWCPYCMELRRFEKRAYMEIDGHLIGAEPAYYCPMCDISHNDAHVGKYNPIVQRLRNGKRSRGRKSKSGKRKRRKK